MARMVQTDKGYRYVDSKPIDIEGTFKKKKKKKRIIPKEVPKNVPAPAPVAVAPKQPVVDESESLMSALRSPRPSTEGEVSPPERMIAGDNDGGSGDPSNLRAILAGATPLLVGFLSGNMGEGIDIAGKALLQEDQRLLQEEGSLISALRKSKAQSIAKAGGSRFSPQKARSGKGLSFDKQTGKYINPDTGMAVEDAQVHTYIQPEAVERRSLSRETGKRAGGVYGRKIIEDREGVKQKFNIATGEKSEIFDSSKHQVSPRFEKRADVVVDKYTADMKPTRDILQSLNEASILLKSDGQLPNKIAIQSIIKKVEGGRMSDEDRAYYTSNVSKLTAVSERYEEELDEKVRARLKREATEVLRVLIARSDKRLSSEAKSRAKGNSRDRNENKYLMKRLQAGGHKGRARIVPRNKGKSTEIDFSNLTDNELEDRINKLQGVK